MFDRHLLKNFILPHYLYLKNIIIFFLNILSFRKKGLYSEGVFFLVEINNHWIDHIVYKYTIDYLDNASDKNIKFFTPRRSFLHLFIPSVILDFRIYKSFRKSIFSRELIGNILVPKIKFTKILNIIHFFFKALRQVKTKTDLENLKIEGILVGDLLYDEILAIEKLPTIRIKSLIFVKHLFLFSIYFIFWQDIFTKYSIKYVLLSHNVYAHGLVCRLAYAFTSLPLLINANNLYKFSEPDCKTMEFKDYKRLFDSLNLSKQKEFIAQAEIELEKRFTGDIDRQVFYLNKSAYSTSTMEDALTRTNRFKVLIATHCFFDNPHALGNNLFPDFYEWLKYLIEFSNNSEYDWYIKVHPDPIPESRFLVKKLITNSKIGLVDENISHHQLMREGISAVLTVYGTIAMEYPYHSRIALNASVNNPHSFYDFSITPKNLSEYEYYLSNLNKIHPVSKKQQILEYYSMKNLYKKSSWLFKNLDTFLQQRGGYLSQFDEKIIDSTHLLEFYEEEEIRNQLSSFFNSSSHNIHYLTD